MKSLLLTLSLLLSLSVSCFHFLVARYGHTSVVLSDGSVLVMGGLDTSGRKNDVWKTTDGGASWIMVTFSAGWTGNTNSINITSLHLLDIVASTRSMS